MRIDLIITRKSDSKSSKITCDVADRVVFGRVNTSPAYLEGPELSREHFALLMRKNVPYVEDLSSNGTAVNGRTIRKPRANRLKQGDVISIPGYDIEVDRCALPALADAEARPGSKAAEQPTRLSRWEAAVALAAVASFGLIVYYIAVV